MSTTEVMPAYFKLRAAATYSGLSLRTVRRMVDSGTLTPHRPTRGTVLISRLELESVLRASANGRTKKRFA